MPSFQLFLFVFLSSYAVPAAANKDKGLTLVVIKNNYMTLAPDSTGKSYIMLSPFG